MNSEPIEFHAVHGENIRIENDRKTARRVESFNQALCFSNRPLLSSEKLKITITQTSNAWSGVLRLGFTDNDPKLFVGNLPKFCCPDLTMRPGNWGRAITDDDNRLNQVLTLWYTPDGKAMLESLNHPAEPLINGIKPHKNLYAVFDVYGNTTSIKIEIHPERLSTSCRSRVPIPSIISLETKLGKLSIDNSLKTHDLFPISTNAEHPGSNSSVNLFALSKATICKDQAIIFKVPELSKCIANVKFALCGEFNFAGHKMTSIPDLCEETYSVQSVLKVLRSNTQIAIAIDEEGAVFATELQDNPQWNYHFHVDSSLKYKLAVEVAKMPNLSIVGVTSDLKPEGQKNRVHAGESIDNSSGTTCVICMEAPREILLEPCYHFALCQSCSNSVNKSALRVCPLCRTQVKSSRKIFLC